MSGPSPTVGNDKPTPAPPPPKKRTAAQAGLDQAVVPNPPRVGAGGAKMDAAESKEASGSTRKSGPDASSGVSGKDWLVEQVARMEGAFKDACYYRALIIRFHVEARYHNLHYVQPNAPRYMVDKYRKACLLWEETKTNVQRYLEEAAKRYVPPVVPVAPVKPEIKAASTPIIASNGPSQTQTAATKTESTLPYIDPRTGLPSPTQPSSLKMAGSAAAKLTTTKEEKQELAPNGKSAATRKNSPAPLAQDSGRKKPATSSTPIDPSTSANSSVNAKFPTGSAGDPIEIDDLDVDMDNAGDFVALTTLPGKDTQPSSKANMPNIPAAVQPEGIGLGLGLGEIDVDLPVSQNSSDAPAANMASEGDVSALLMNIQNAVAATTGQAQLLEEDIMKFFESLPPGGEQADMGTASLMGGNGTIDGNGLETADQFLSNPAETGNGLPLDQPPAVSADGINMDSMEAATAGDFGGFTPQAENAMPSAAVDDGGMPEELDLSNMDWTQYSALLAEIPDDS